MVIFKLIDKTNLTGIIQGFCEFFLTSKLEIVLTLVVLSCPTKLTGLYRTVPHLCAVFL